MSKEAVENTFKVIGAMEELRDLFRKTAPIHRFTPAEREEALSLIDQAKTSLEEIKRWLNSSFG